MTKFQQSTPVIAILGYFITTFNTIDISIGVSCCAIFQIEENIVLVLFRSDTMGKCENFHLWNFLRLFCHIMLLFWCSIKWISWWNSILITLWILFIVLLGLFLCKENSKRITFWIIDTLAGFKNSYPMRQKKAERKTFVMNWFYKVTIRPWRRIMNIYWRYNSSCERKTYNGSFHRKILFSWKHLNLGHSSQTRKKKWFSKFYHLVTMFTL